eukprot:1785547-Pyramimonas_sp.AAC.1
MDPAARRRRSRVSRELRAAEEGGGFRAAESGFRAAEGGFKAAEEGGGYRAAEEGGGFRAAEG